MLDFGPQIPYSSELTLNQHDHHMTERIAKKIYDSLMSAEHILLIPHNNPDGDALGSVAACMQFLRREGKAHVAYCSSPIPDRMHFLPHTQYVTNDDSIWEDESIDCIVVFDSGDLRFAGVAKQIASLKQDPTIINIDHHVTNEEFGNLNLVMAKASSTTEILYHFFTYNGIELDSYIATCLLTGLVTDTDNFTNAATTMASLSIASNLISLGGDLNLIKGWMFRDKSVNSLKLWGTVLARLIHHPRLDIVYTYITQEDLEYHDVTEDEASGIANFLNSIKEGRAGLLLKELHDGKVKGSFRTTRDDVDVGEMALALGGGGHQKAAGFTIDGPLDHAKERVFEILKQARSSQDDQALVS
jgi:phosphoesterase RecJ-like protein